MLWQKKKKNNPVIVRVQRPFGNVVKNMLQKMQKQMLPKNQAN